LLLLVMALSLGPTTPETPGTGWDKTNHLLAFAVLACLGCHSYAASVGRVMAGLLLYGGLIELLQSFTPDRLAEWGDVLADALGLLLGWAVMRLVLLVRRRVGG
jgi:VanZ family protein